MNEPLTRRREPRGVAKASARAIFSAANPLGGVQEKLDHAESVPTSGAGSSKRSFRRWPYRVGILPVTIRCASGGTTHTKMTARDISPTGLGVLHLAYAHLGSMVSFSLPDPSGGEERVSGKVVRCKHIDGMAHYLGIELDQEIDPSRFEPSIQTGQRLAREGSVSGAVLHIEDCAIDRALVSRALKDTGLSVTAVGSFEEAKQRIQNNWTVILCDQRLPDGLGSDFATTFRDAGNSTPFILLTADDTPAARTAFVACPADAVLYKPVGIEALRDAVISLAIAPPSDGEAHTALTASDASTEILIAYIQTLRTQGRLLQQHWEKRDASACLNIAIEIAGSAEPYGFGQIGQEARHMHDVLAADEWTVEAAASVRRVMTLCQQVRPPQGR